MNELPDNAIKLNVMVVDDDEDHRWITGDAVADTPYDCVLCQAATGEEAWEILEGRRSSGLDRPDILFLDIEMPGMGGLALLGRLKADPELSKITIVVVSDGGEFANRRLEAFRRGADDFIEKNRDVIGMIRNLKQCVHRQGELKLADNNCLNM